MATIDVAVVMGSDSDLEQLEEGIALLKRFGLAAETRILSAHRTPDALAQYVRGLAERGAKVVIAAAGGAAHLPGVVASLTPLPVIGVPMVSKNLNGLDSLLSIVQMPAGIPVATMAIGKAGASNAAIFAARILGLANPQIRDTLETYRREMEQKVLEKDRKMTSGGK